MFENLRGDIAAVRKTNTERGWWKQFGITQTVRALLNMGMSCVVAYRFGHWVEGVRIPVVKQILWLMAAFFRRWVGLWTAVFISPKADIGPGFVIHTVYGINIGTVKIGRNCTVSSGVLISCGTRSVGDNVYFGAGAKVIGDTKIGNNVVIMPNSLILTDVPDNTTIVGVPARIKLRGGRPQRFEPAQSTNSTEPPKKETKTVLVKE